MADFFAYRVVVCVTAMHPFGVLSVFLMIFYAYDDKAQLEKKEKN